MGAVFGTRLNKLTYINMSVIFLTLNFIIRRIKSLGSFMTDSIYLHSDISTILRMDLFILLISCRSVGFKENINPNFYPKHLSNHKNDLNVDKIINICG